MVRALTSRTVGTLLLATGLAVGWNSSMKPLRVSAATVIPSLQTLVAEGERLWMNSADPGNPVACATCHRDPAKTRGWAASFPKFKPLPPPHSRVMTLLQANAEAVERHYRLSDPLPAATAITAYLTSLGADVPISPGISNGQPVFPARMQELAASVGRGGNLYARRCGRCHETASVALAVTAFPRVTGERAESLESFLERHNRMARPLRWDSPATADIMAYLASHAAGRPAGHVACRVSHKTKEGQCCT